MQFSMDDLYLHFCRKTAEGDVTVMPSVTCMDW